MSIQFKKIPRALKKLIQNPKLIASLHEVHQNAFTKISKDHQQHQPHPIYILDAENLEKENIFKNIKISGWRFIIDTGEKRLAYEFAVDFLTEFRIHSIDEGLHTNNFSDVVFKLRDILEDLSAIKFFPYEIALLNIPVLYTTTIWLKPKRFSSFLPEIFFPIRPMPGFLKEQLWYDRGSMVQKIKEEFSKIKERGSALLIDADEEFSTSTEEAEEHIEQTEDLPVKPNQE